MVNLWKLLANISRITGATCELQTYKIGHVSSKSNQSPVIGYNLWRESAVCSSHQTTTRTEEEEEEEEEEERQQPERKICKNLLIRQVTMKAYWIKALLPVRTTSDRQLKLAGVSKNVWPKIFKKRPA